MQGGYIEWVTEDRVGFITNPFGRILYINADFPEGDYKPFKMRRMGKQLKEHCRECRRFTYEELLLELI